MNDSFQFSRWRLGIWIKYSKQYMIYLWLFTTIARAFLNLARRKNRWCANSYANATARLAINGTLRRRYHLLSGKKTEKHWENWNWFSSKFCQPFIGARFSRTSTLCQVFYPVVNLKFDFNSTNKFLQSIHQFIDRLQYQSWFEPFIRYVVYTL